MSYVKNSLSSGVTEVILLLKDLLCDKGGRLGNGNLDTLPRQTSLECGVPRTSINNLFRKDFLKNFRYWGLKPEELYH